MITFLACILIATIVVRLAIEIVHEIKFLRRHWHD